jgi:hypothetical protein
MMERITEASPLFKARTAGVFYLLVFLTGGSAAFVSGGLVVDGDAAATATNILAHAPLLRLDQRWKEQPSAAGTSISK